MITENQKKLFVACKCVERILNSEQNLVVDDVCKITHTDDIVFVLNSDSHMDTPTNNEHCANDDLPKTTSNNVTTTGRNVWWYLCYAVCFVWYFIMYLIDEIAGTSKHEN
ncbi:MAG: hypothetical protein QXY15_10940 [Candidatus Nitrosotenuis sp.]